MNFTRVGDKNSIDWIEILLNAGIPDGRHRIISNILAPYLITVKGLELSEAQQIIERWVDKCDRFEPLKGNISAFIARSCQQTYRLRKKPKDMDYLKTHHNNVYSEIVDMAEAYEIKLE